MQVRANSLAILQGLRNVDLLVSDDHSSLVRALRQHFQDVTRQQYQTHFTRNILDATPKALKDEVHNRVRHKQKYYRENKGVNGDTWEY